jgi:DNA polymerase III psi subunit
METKSDYFSSVLGLSLKGAAALEVDIETTERDQFLFYVNREDFENHKSLVQKILNAAQKNDGIVITELADIKKLNPLEVFSFGEAVELMGIKVISFPSFDEISKDPKQKAKLWNELKRRI